MKIGNEDEKSRRCEHPTPNILLPRLANSPIMKSLGIIGESWKPKHAAPAKPKALEVIVSILGQRIERVGWDTKIEINTTLCVRAVFTRSAALPIHVDNRTIQQNIRSCFFRGLLIDEAVVFRGHGSTSSSRERSRAEEEWRESP